MEKYSWQTQKEMERGPNRMVTCAIFRLDKDGQRQEGVKEDNKRSCWHLRAAQCLKRLSQ